MKFGTYQVRLLTALAIMLTLLALLPSSSPKPPVQESGAGDLCAASWCEDAFLSCVSFGNAGRNVLVRSDMACSAFFGPELACDAQPHLAGQGESDPLPGLDTRSTLHLLRRLQL
ncbi:MAG: hypothetical protein IT365_26975 [Candidatus Hydrogenedentes bacterium]|nr:hypothetical protein [Candidatus Hydrogenedentota bacterium]